ncbi:MAG: ABC transporter substrate-binding protein [bacterium]|nr:ABC transporter substrate-binding protein [bacterium]
MARAIPLTLVLALVAAAAWYAHGALSDPDANARPRTVTLRTVTLPGGEQLQVPGRPLRVLPANASAVDVVVDLLSPERIVALPRTAFEYASIAEDPAPWRAHGVMHNFTSEEILAHAPDVVLTQTNQDRATVERVRESGVFVFDLPVATDWAGLLAGVELAGLVLGETEAAERLTRELEARRAKIDAGPAAGKRALPYGNYGGAGYTAGTGTTWELMIELAGMRNAASVAGIHGNPPVDFEQVLVIDPDLFVVGAKGRSQHSPSAAILNAEASLASMTAIGDGRVVILPDDLYSTASHRLLAAAEELAARAAAAYGDE